MLFSTPLFYTSGMNDRSDKKGWERTNVTNLLRNGQSGTYYARVKVNGKEKWKSLKTSAAGARQSKDCADMVRLLAYSTKRVSIVSSVMPGSGLLA